MDTSYFRKLISRARRCAERLAPGGFGLYQAFVPLNQEFKPIVESAANSPLLQRALTSSSLPELLNALFKTAIIIGALVAVLRIAYAGYTLMMSDIAGSRASAKDIIMDAVIGLVLLLAVWVILETINPQLLNIDLLRSLTPVQR